MQKGQKEMGRSKFRVLHQFCIHFSLTFTHSDSPSLTFFFMLLLFIHLFVSSLVIHFSSLFSITSCFRIIYSITPYPRCLGCSLIHSPPPLLKSLPLSLPPANSYSEIISTLLFLHLVTHFFHLSISRSFPHPLLFLLLKPLPSTSLSTFTSVPHFLPFASHSLIPFRFLIPFFSPVFPSFISVYLIILFPSPFIPLPICFHYLTLLLHSSLSHPFLSYSFLLPLIPSSPTTSRSSTPSPHP